VAVASGLAAMYGVHYLMQVMYRLGHDGTARIERSIGRTGTVYVPIPASKTGSGKIQLQVQDRIMEYQAVTNHTEKLATGAKVVVVGIIGPSTVEVRLSEQMAEA
jgi:membrane protein implicated in regulation of membrane protease activity